MANSNDIVQSQEIQDTFDFNFSKFDWKNKLFDVLDRIN